MPTEGGLNYLEAVTNGGAVGITVIVLLLGAFGRELDDHLSQEPAPAPCAPAVA